MTSPAQNSSPVKPFEIHVAERVTRLPPYLFGRINALLHGLPALRNTLLLDLGSQWLQSDGTLPRELMSDFCHPTDKSYQIWADALRPLLSEFMLEGARIVFIMPPGSTLLPDAADLPVLTLFDEDGAAARFTLPVVSTPGTAIFLAGVISAFVLPGMGLRRALDSLGKTIVSLRETILTVCLVLATAFVMNASGMSVTLGSAIAATGVLFPLFSPLLGWMGVLVTGSDTSSNALFGALQRTTAEKLGLNPALMVASSASGLRTGALTVATPMSKYRRSCAAASSV